MTEPLDHAETPILSDRNNWLNRASDQTPLIARVENVTLGTFQVVFYYQTSAEPGPTVCGPVLHLHAPCTSISSYWNQPGSYTLELADALESQKTAVHEIAGEGEKSRELAGKALQAVDDLKGWLLLTEQRVAHLCGFSRRNFRNWRSGERGAYPATVRGLFEIRSVVKALIDELGTEGARAWLDIVEEGSSDPRLEKLARAAGRRELMSSANNLIFERVRDSPGVVEASSASESDFVRPPEPGDTRPAAPVRRPRKK